MIYKLNNDLADTGWIYPTISGNFEAYTEGWKPRYRKIGSLVEICGAIKPKKSMILGQDSVTIFTLPEDLKPMVNIPQLCQGSARAMWYCEADSSGNVNVGRYRESFSTYANIDTSTWMPFNITYIVD